MSMRRLTCRAYAHIVEESVTEFIGIYDADSTIIGEVSYWIGARLGRRHCSLCDITHGLFTEKAEWKLCRESVQVAFTTFHRNDAPADALTAAKGSFPCVLARRNEQLTVVLRPADLELLDGSPEALMNRLLVLEGR
jgi:hypothetical protein